MNYFSILPIMLILSSCDEGGSASSNHSSNISDATSVTINQQQELSSSNNLDELMVAEDFDFIGKESLKIRVIDQSLKPGRRYLNVCSDYTEINGQPQINYSSCQIRTSLQTTYSEYTLALSSAKQSLIAQVWSVSDGSIPSTFYWISSKNKNDWDIVL